MTRHRLLESFGIASLFVLLAVFVPDSWLAGVQNIFGERTPRVTAFSPEIAEIDEAGVEHADFQKHRTLVAMRRLLKSGPLTFEERKEVDKTIHAFFRDIESAPKENYDAIIARHHQDLVSTYPRLKPDKTLEALRSMLPQGGAKTCTSCHTQVRRLPGAKTFDSIGIYPLISPKHFEDGRAIPLMTESLEMAAWKKTIDDKTATANKCTDCHVKHGEPNFDVDMERRETNLGIWLNLSKYGNAIRAEVKTKSFDSAHRAPGGMPGSAYVYTLEPVGEDGKQLDYIQGYRLPEQIRDRFVYGRLFAKILVDDKGRYTSNIADAVGLLADTRLLSHRFSVDHYLFKATAKNTFVAKLHYLPKFPSWDDAVVIFEVERSE